MADRKITELSAMSAGGQATGDLLTIVDVSEAAAADKNKKITMENLFKGIPGDVGINTASPGRTLDVNGVIRSDGTSGRFELGGNSSTPSVGAAIHRPANSTLAFVTNSSEKLRLDSSGRLLINTSSEISSSTPDGSVHMVATGGGKIYMMRDSSSVAAGSDLGMLRFYSNDGGEEESVRIEAEADAAHSAGNKPGRLVFRTSGSSSASPTERMVVDSAGNVGIGNTSPTAKLMVGSNPNGTTLASGGGALSLARNGDTFLEFWTTGGTQSSKILFNQSGTEVGNIEYVSSSLRFNVNESERLRVDSSGRLLVGTSSNIGSGSDNRDTFVGLASAGAGLLLGRNDTSTVATNNIGKIEFWGNDSNGTYEQCASIIAEADLDHATGDKPTRLLFSTTADGASSPTERVRISENGRFSAYSDSDTVFAVRNAGTTATSAAFALYNNSTSTTTGTVKCVIRQDGDLENTNNNYGSLSDVKLKENIVDAASQWDDLKAIQVRKYNFKEETGHETHTQIGVIAQEIETVSPGLVSESPDLDDEGNDLGTVTKSVNYSVLYMKAVKALQEAMDRIETLEAKVAALEAQ